MKDEVFSVAKIAIGLWKNDAVAWLYKTDNYLIFQKKKLKT